MALLRAFRLESDHEAPVNVRETDDGMIEIRKTGSRSRITLSPSEARELYDVLNELT